MIYKVVRIKPKSTFNVYIQFNCNSSGTLMICEVFRTGTFNMSRDTLRVSIKQKPGMNYLLNF